MRLKPAKTLTSKNFNLLLSFLLDSQLSTRDLVKTQLKEAFQKEPGLRKRIHQSANPAIRYQAELIAEELAFERILPELEHMARAKKDVDLERGLYLLARLNTPSLSLTALSMPLDRLAEEVNQRLAKEAALPTRAIHALRRTVFDDHGYKPAQKNKNDLQHCFLDHVLRKKQGNAITLSALYLLVCSRLGLLVHAIGLPGHVIVGHRVPRSVVWMDPSQGGRILRHKDCEVLVRRLGFSFREEYLDPLSNRELIGRLLAQMISITTEEGALARAHWLSVAFQKWQSLEPGQTSQG